MNICLIIDSLVAAGAERVVVTLAESFYEKGYQVDIILFKDCIEYEINPNIKIHILNPKTPESFSQLIKELEKKNQQSFDYIFSHLHNKIKVLKQSKVPNIYYTFHIPISKRFEKGNFFIKFLKKKKMQYRYKNENLITVSEGIKKDLIQHNFKAKSITTIYNPFNFKSILENAKIQDEDIPKEEYIINVARFHFQKRQDILLKAFAKSGLDCKLLLVGKGSKEEMDKVKTLIKELNLEKQIILVGFKSNPFPLIKHAKLFVLSSDFEGFGMVLVESLILGTPTVSTNCPSGPSEVMQGELSNYLVPVGDIDALAKKMYEAFYNPPTIELKFLEQFDAHNITKKYLSLKENTNE